MPPTKRDDAESTDRAIAAAVKTLLDARELTVADLSYNAGIPISTLYRKLGGTQAWKAGDIARVARYLGVSPNDLFSGSPVLTHQRRVRAVGSSNHARMASTREYARSPRRGPAICGARAAA